MSQWIKPLPTQQRLREVLHYDPATGILTWLKNHPAVRDGARQAGTNTPHGYRVVCIDKRNYPAHRVAFKWLYGRDPKQYLDHINRDRLDNRICNLREADASQNRQNAALGSANKSGIRGVSQRMRSGRWVAQIKIAGRNVTLGEFISKDDAAAAYREASRKHHREFSTC